MSLTLFAIQRQQPSRIWKWLQAGGAVLGLLTSLGSMPQALAEERPPTAIRVPPFDGPRDGRPGYFFELLNLALKKTQDTHGPAEVSVVKGVFSLERALSELKKGQLLDVVFTAPNPGLTEGVRVIPVSLLGELNNYRILLIRQGDQARFDRIQSLDELRTLTAGLGLQWVDTKVMRSNGFRVEGSTLHDKLFSMLAAKRFDFFPRGLHEVQTDLDRFRDLGLAMEEKLFLYYEAPFYFFVNAANRRLAERIETGLRIALTDGSFGRLMASYPHLKAAMALQRTATRKLLRLEPITEACWAALASASAKNGCLRARGG